MTLAVAVVGALGVVCVVGMLSVVYERYGE